MTISKVNIQITLKQDPCGAPSWTSHQGQRTTTLVFVREITIKFFSSLGSWGRGKIRIHPHTIHLSIM
jgi:hypothetical protein